MLCVDVPRSTTQAQLAARPSRLWSSPTRYVATLSERRALHARTILGLTPLQLAAAHNRNPAVVDRLLAHGANLHERTPDGLTLLHLAVQDTPNRKGITGLLSAGVDPAATNYEGHTATHLAVAHRAPQTVVDLLARAERAPWIFDATPFRDKNRLFFNAGTDVFGTEQLAEREAYSRCNYQELFRRYPELFSEDPGPGECNESDILREGTDPILLEAQIVGDIGLGGQGRVRALAAAVERRRDGRFHWTWQAYATMLLRLRMMKSRSRPVLPPSFMPKGTFQVMAFRRDARRERATMLVGHFVFGHHSNGQTGCSFLDQIETATGECLAVSDAPPRSRQYLNYANGNFSTHYVQAGLYLRKLALASELAVRSETSYGAGLEWHLPCVPGALCELEALYGRKRVWLSVVRETGSYEYGLRVMRILNDDAIARLWLEGELVRHIGGRLGIYMRGYRVRIRTIFVSRTPRRASRWD